MFGMKPVEDNTVESWRQVLANRRCYPPTADTAHDQRWHQQQQQNCSTMMAMAMMTILQLCGMLNILKNTIW
jgi:hypothetical protein